MITRMGQLFHLETPATSYIFHILKSGHLEHLYYGAHIDLACEEDAMVLSEKNPFTRGNTNAYDTENAGLALEDTCLEMSTMGRGDIREPFAVITYPDGSSTSNFLYEKAEISKGKPGYETLPGSYGTEDQVDHLTVTLKEEASDLHLELHYYVYEDCDVITRSAKLINAGSEPVRVERLMSLQLDFDHCGLTMTSFGGGWGREMKKTENPLLSGKYVSESLAGTSSSRANPFFMVHDPKTTEDAGDCYGFNLIYSGNHYECCQVSGFGKLRIVTGIHPETFSWKLMPGEAFEAPEACMTFSGRGKNRMSQHMHAFVRKHIVRGKWQKKVRPVLVNSWEAMYFGINEAKLVALAKAGADLGAELFVLDDGWFGQRNDDHRSLGDWTVNEKKLPNGLAGLAEKINALGMDFGLWVEPEMVNVDSDLYRQHPDWAVDIPGRAHSEGRTQRFLDLSRKDVQDFVIESMTKVFGSANITYVKWDMNRIFSDIFSKELPADRQGEMMHRYYMGLYRCMKTLTERFPEILFEGCASGGNRFDLGVLCYFPQIWASDNTDPMCRSEIQNNYSYGYPLSAMGCHVSSSPNHQTLRETPSQTRFNVAAFGLLGYELNISDLSEKEKQEIRDQIAFYKSWRSVLQFGRFYRGRAFGAEPGYNGFLNKTDANVCEWTVVSHDKTRAVGMLLGRSAIPNMPADVYYPKGLNPNMRYHFENRPQKINVMDLGSLINTATPVHIKPGSMVHKVVADVVKMEGEKEDYTAFGSLLTKGVRLQQTYACQGWSNDLRHFPDYASRIYTMSSVEQDRK